MGRLSFGIASSFYVVWTKSPLGLEEGGQSEHTWCGNCLVIAGATFRRHGQFIICDGNFNVKSN